MDYRCWSIFGVPKIPSFSHSVSSQGRVFLRRSSRTWVSWEQKKRMKNISHFVPLIRPTCCLEKVLSFSMAFSRVFPTLRFPLPFPDKLRYHLVMTLPVRHGKIHHAIKFGKPSISIGAIEKPWRTVSHQRVFHCPWPWPWRFSKVAGRSTTRSDFRGARFPGGARLGTWRKLNPDTLWLWLT